MGVGQTKDGGDHSSMVFRQKRDDYKREMNRKLHRGQK